jgi:PAS domain S-box-containing protein
MKDVNMIGASALEALEDPFVCFDRNFRIVEANEAALSLFGCKRQELLGSAIIEYLTTTSGLIDQGMMTALFTHSDWHTARNNWMDFCLRRRDGSSIDVVIASICSGGKDNEYCTALIRSSQHDRSVCTLSREELADAHVAKQRFLSSMSHELRTPLNAIIGFSDIIGKEVFGPASPPQYVDYAGDITDAASHMLDLVADILDFTSLTENHRLFEFSPVDMVSTLRYAAGLVNPVAQKVNVTINLDTQQAPMLVLADERAVRQIMLNLLSNAIRFNEDGGSVDVRARLEDGHGVLDVEDSGMGIASGDVERIFDPFATLQEDSYQSGQYGAGLGLAIVRRLADAMDADITLRSVPDKGTTVSVAFPLALPQ